MKIITNEKLIRRNTRFGQFAMYGALAMVGAMIYFYATGQALKQTSLSWLLILGCFLLSQVSIYFVNRWGRRPRSDELIDRALKGADDRYAIYHYTSPTSHLLVCPAGIWAILSYYQRGTIVYEKGRWRQKAGGCMQMYMRFFAQEGLGRPDMDVSIERDAVTKYLNKLLPDKDLPPVQVVLVFLSAQATLEVEDPPHPTLALKDLKEFMRKAAKDKALNQQQIEEIVQALGEE
jgi:hypothetical protein